MKKLLLSTVAFAGLTAGAMAADLPARRAAPAPFVAVPVFTWTGFYVGVNAGYGWADNNDGSSVFLPAGSVINSAGTTGTLTINNGDGDRNGFVGGAQVGYNWQFGMFVVGVEADIQYADLGSNSRNGFPGSYTFVGTPGLAFAPPAATVVSGGSSVDWFGTVRARAGVAIDRALVYATGGFAYGGGDDSCSGFVGCGGGNTRGGYAVGGGVEYAFTNNLTAKLEGLYVNLDRSRNNGAAVFNAATNTLFLGNRGDNDFGLVRVGLNYKFNSF